ncbi:type III-B CRISPR module-associated protein Cmr3 [bacterium]|nr:type III-B CRISPR module-associated protein Cmr3 [bacterium]
MAPMTLRLHPVDVLMFRETRWFGTGAGASESVFPPPRTIAGALRTYLLDACGANYGGIRTAMREARRKTGLAGYWPVLKTKLKEVAGAAWPVDAEIIGPFLGRDDERYFPVPRTIVRDLSGPVPTPASLRPVTVGSSPARTLLATGSDLHWEPLPDGFIHGSDLQAYLEQGTLPEHQILAESAGEEVILKETRVGVAIDGDTGTAAEGLLYTSTFSRLQKGWYLEVDLKLDSPGYEHMPEHVMERPWLRLGGDGKVARVEIVDKPWQPWSAPASAVNTLIYLATPALFGGGSPTPSSVGTIRAAATGRPLAFSGWDLAANLPMKSRYAVQAGAVYFLDQAPAVQHGTCISDDPEDRAAGWGYCLRGVWQA